MADLLATHLPSLFAPGRRPAWRRRVARRVLAGVLLALALTVALGRGAPEPGTPALVAVTDIAAGSPVAPDAVAVVERPISTVPESALRETGPVVGRLTTVPVVAGEILTPARVLTGEAASVGPGRRLVTVPLLGAARSVVVGDLVDVYRPGRGEPVAEQARVVAVPSTADDLSAVPEPTAVLSLPARQAATVVDALGEEATVGFVLTVRGTPQPPDVR